MNNLKLNISTRPINTGPLTETITIPCSKGFKELVDLVCKLRDIKEIFSVEPYLDKPLREALKRF